MISCFIKIRKPNEMRIDFHFTLRSYSTLRYIVLLHTYSHLVASNICCALILVEGFLSEVHFSISRSVGDVPKYLVPRSSNALTLGVGIDSYWVKNSKSYSNSAQFDSHGTYINMPLSTDRYGGTLIILYLDLAHLPQSCINTHKCS